LEMQKVIVQLNPLGVRACGGACDPRVSPAAIQIEPLQGSGV